MKETVITTGNNLLITKNCEHHCWHFLTIIYYRGAKILQNSEMPKCLWGFLAEKAIFKKLSSKMLCRKE